MAKLNGAQIKEKAVEIIAKHPEGIGPTGLLRIIEARHPETANGTIRGAVWKLDQDFPHAVAKGPSGYYLKGGAKPAADVRAAKAKPEKKVTKPARRAKAERPKASAKAESQEAELRRLNAELAKVQKIVCGA